MIFLYKFLTLLTQTDGQKVSNKGKTRQKNNNES